MTDEAKNEVKPVEENPVNQPKTDTVKEPSNSERTENTEKELAAQVVDETVTEAEVSNAETVPESTDQEVQKEVEPKDQETEEEKILAESQTETEADKTKEQINIIQEDSEPVAEIISEPADQTKQKEEEPKAQEAANENVLPEPQVENLPDSFTEEESENQAQKNPEPVVEAEDEGKDGESEIQVQEEVDTLPEPQAVIETEKTQDQKNNAETESEELAKPEPEVSDKSTNTDKVSADAGQTETVPMGTDEEVPEEMIDYNQLGKEELVSSLEELLNSTPIGELKGEVEKIKSAFYKKHRAEVEKLKKAYLADGGDPLSFEYPPDPNEEAIKKLLNLYRRLKAEYLEALEKEKQENLKKKLEIIDKIDQLINNQESINKTFQEFKDLQEEWHAIGQIPQSEIRNTWNTYNHHCEKFYDYIKINRELRDLDFKKNLEIKLKLCEKAEELLLEPSVVKAFNALQKLHDQWRETGPVHPEKREELWERFKLTTASINKAHQDHYQKIKEDQVNNLKAKTLLCEKVEEIAENEPGNPKAWDQKTEELIQIQQLWKTIGFATKKENARIFERFRKACDDFFAKKRDYFKEYKDVQNNNLQLKTELVIQAEALADSTEWKETSNQLIELQKKWKEIGPVPRKNSDEIWKRFRAACNKFFDRKSEFFGNLDSIQEENLKKKQEIIQKIKAIDVEEKAEDNLNQLKTLQSAWAEIGHVPFKQKDKIQKEYREAINSKFEKLKIDEVKRNVWMFKQRMENISDQRKKNKQINYEREKTLGRIRQLENDIQVLENNIGFFAKTKNAESLIKDVQKKIETARKNIIIEKQKLDLIHKIDH